MSRGDLQGERRARTIAYVRERGQVSRGDIAREFSLDKKAVSILVEGLIRDGILEVCGRSPSAAGRRRDQLGVRADIGCFVGVDLGATHVIGVLTDASGAVLDRAYFEIRPGLPVTVEDSSRAFAVAERWLGHSRGSRDFVALDLGYGVGMGIIAGGALYTGSAWKSGEIGHTVVEPDGIACACGNRGCLETVASGRAIARQATQGIRDGRSTLLSELTHGNPDRATAQDVGVAAGMGDTFSSGLLSGAGRAVGLALANAVNLFNPSLVVLGGGLVSAGPVFTESIASALSRYAMPGIREDLTLEVSTLGVDASARGAAAIASAVVFEPARTGPLR